MLNIRKILLPVDFPNASLPVIHQAAALARRFHSQIVMLHAVTHASVTAGVPPDGSEHCGWDMLSEIIKTAQRSSDHTLGAELDGLAIQRVLVKDGATQAILRTAQTEKADLIMMASHGHTFSEFLLGAAAVEALHTTQCPVWTGAHIEESAAQNFAIRNILCALDRKPRDRKTASWAAHIAGEFGARLTLTYVTADVKCWGPGGSSVNRDWKEALVDDAAWYLRGLQKKMGIKANLFIGSGDVSSVLCQAVKQTNADLLVTGCHPYGGRLRTHGYANICAVPIPCVSV